MRLVDARSSFVILIVRILLLSNCPLDRNQGSGYVMLGYAERMRARGHCVVGLGIEHFTPFPGMRRLTRVRRLAGFTWTALRLARPEDYDVVELWGAEGWLAVLLLSWIGRCRPLPVSRSNGLETHWASRTRAAEGIVVTAGERFSDRLKEIAFRRAQALTVVSHFDGRFAASKRYQPDSRLLVLENPLDSEWLGQAPMFDREPLVGFVGGWLARKGCERIPEVIGLVLAERPGARFVLIGIGEAGEQAIGAAFGDDPRIQVVRFAPRAQIREQFHRMAVLMMPSFFESFGLVAAEAMACGAALAAAPTGLAADLGLDEYERIGDLTSSGIAGAVLRLLRNEQRRQQIARAGHARVQSLRWEEAVDRLETTYQTLLTAQRPLDAAEGAPFERSHQ
jgi:glycosyltransferase involved in cell wall biosynthesis